MFIIIFKGQEKNQMAPFGVIDNNISNYFTVSAFLASISCWGDLKVGAVMLLTHMHLILPVFLERLW